ncbi:MAG: PadR family transcriptional regulator [Gemmatimonadales bacterium]
MTASRADIPPGTLDMLILRTVDHRGEAHGFEIAEAIQRASTDVLQVEEGSLYPALQRLLIKGWLVDKWGRTAENRRARYYRITPAGRKQLARELESYQRVTHAIAAVLRPA